MKIDFHCHSYYSRDGFSAPEDLIKTARKKGLDGIALTDHDTSRGWKEAALAAEKLKVSLVLGEEIKTDKGDVLGLFLKNEIKPGRFVDIVKEIKTQGGVAIVAHPFHFVEYFKDDLEKYKDLIDGVEAFNARLPFYSGDKTAFDFAKKYNLAMTAGSDAHYYKEIGNACAETEAGNQEEFKNGILNRKTRISGVKSPLYSLVFPALARMGMKRKP